MRMGHQNTAGMIASKIFELSWRRRILGQERIDQEIRSTGRNDLERRMPEPGDRDFLFHYRRRRLRGYDVSGDRETDHKKSYTCARHDNLGSRQLAAQERSRRGFKKKHLRICVKPRP